MRIDSKYDLFDVFVTHPSPLGPRYTGIDWANEN